MARPVTSSRQRAKTGLHLVPEQGVTLSNGAFHADSLPAWLSMPDFFDVCGRNWFSIRYSCGFFDRPIRPLLRFQTSTGRAVTYILNGPVLGSAEWVGRVPDNARAVSICTTDRLGPFAFRIEDARPVSRAALAGRHSAAAASRSKRLATSRRSDAWQYEIDLYKIANRATPMAQYPQWAKRFRREPEFDDFDSPRSDWTLGPDFALMMTIDRATRADAVRATIETLKQQVYPRWRLVARYDENVGAETLRIFQREAEQDERLCVRQPPQPLAATDGADWMGWIAPGDTLEPIALASFAEEIARNPDIRAIYSDEDAFDAQGSIHSPKLKPDWSPLFQQGTNYIGGLTCIRKDAMASAPFADEVLHIKRILYHRSNRRGSLASAIPLQRSRETDMDDAALPDASIIIVTKDRPELLRACLEGLQHRTDYPHFNVVIVDNGTTDTAALSLIGSVASDDRFVVVRHSGPFNFSALSNLGAAQTTSPLLVFLNNDVEMLDSQWLRLLAKVAMRPETGVAGARLLYPDGRIQHTGVTLSLGMVCGHLYSGAPADGAGYLDDLKADREVSAVTGACCAVTREKFEALGGFDAANLPVEFSDIDLCLRAREQGWTTICVTDAVLVHHESKSRGVAPASTYRAERDYFLQRWMEVIRDDPFFHPGLSMFALAPCLG